MLETTVLVKFSSFSSSIHTSSRKEFPTNRLRQLSCYLNDFIHDVAIKENDFFISSCLWFLLLPGGGGGGGGGGSGGGGGGGGGGGSKFHYFS